jgi:hypothetical protein
MICVFPCSPIDQDLAVKLSYWMVDLGRNAGHHALLVTDDRVHPNNNRAIKHNLAMIFESVEEEVMTERFDGWPLAPNRIFAKAAKRVQMTSPQPWLWLEADVVPLKSGWVAALAKEYDAEPRKPFLGDFVNVKDVPAHMSGIAVYPGMVVDHAGAAVMATDIAWDVFAADQIVPKMKQTRLIAHRWKHPPFASQSEVDNLLAQLPTDCVLFHADKSGTLIDFLRERKKGKAQVAPPKPEIADIFIKTYPKDYPWLEYCLRSIKTFGEGFRNTIVISSSPCQDHPEVEWQTRVEYGEGSANQDNYLSQQIFKLNADTFSDADWILHIDSDTIFTRAVTPQVYLREGKFVWMITPIAQAHPNEEQAWRHVMERFLGKPPEFEFMRRFPFLFPRWLYDEFRKFCVTRHRVPIEQYVMSQPYREFSEFNCIGFYAYEYHRDKFIWVNTTETEEKDWPPLTVDQRWSHNPIPTEEWEKILGGADGPEKERPSSIAVDPAPTQTSSAGNGATAIYVNAPYIPEVPAMESVRSYAQALGKYAKRDGFALMRVRKELKAAGLLPKKGKK